MLALPVLTDPVFVKSARYSRLDAWFVSKLRDERDLPFIWLTIRILAVLVPMAVAIYLLPAYSAAWWVVAAVHFILNNFKYKGPFGLMLHCSSHRPLFAAPYARLNDILLPWIVAPLFGQTPESYFAHHIGMHHPENNLEEDGSSTMRYQRDSVQSFLAYYLSFITAGPFQLLRYLREKGRSNLARRFLQGEAAFYAVVIALGFVNLPATVVVFILPYFILRLIMMVGNWTQHAFVSAEQPENDYQNSITCINTKYNHQCWNDGYHTSHHQKPTLHWTEHPAHFTARLQEYAEQEAVVFSGITFLHVFAWLMLHRYDKLARHFVDLGNRFNSDAEVAAFLRMRTARITTAPVAVAA